MVHIIAPEVAPSMDSLESEGLFQVSECSDALLLVATLTDADDDAL